MARFGLFTFHESPKFLISKGRDEEAVEVVKHVRAFNRRKGFGFSKLWKRSADVRAEEESVDDDLLTMEDLQECERVWEERQRDHERFERMSCDTCDCECECELGDGIEAGSGQARFIDGLPAMSGGSNAAEIGRLLAGAVPTSVHMKTNSDEGLVVSTSKHDVEAPVRRPGPGGRTAHDEGGGWQRQFGHLKALFSTWGMVRLTLLTWICYIADYWRVSAFQVSLLYRRGTVLMLSTSLCLCYRGFVIAGNFLPKFLADRGAAADQSTYDTYRN